MPRIRIGYNDKLMFHPSKYGTNEVELTDEQYVEWTKLWENMDRWQHYMTEHAEPRPLNYYGD
jgi:hypothetical protein